MQQKLVSVIMPTYNCEKFVAASIESIKKQTYENWELIIVDDFSSDATYELLQAYSESDDRIKIVRNNENKGAAITRNIAMDLARGYFIAFCDSDDLWLPNKLERQLNFMEKNNYLVTCTAYEQIDEKGNLLGKIINCLPKADYNRILLDCPVGNSTVIYNVSKLGKFKVPNIRKRNDDALWLQILKKEKYIYGLSEVHVQYRIRNNSISSNKFSLIKYHWILYRRIERLSIIRSLFHICYWGFIKLLKIK